MTTTTSAPPRTKRLWDIIERVVWTLLQAGVAELIIQAVDIPQAWVVPIAGVLALIKSLLASKFGQTSAATLPATVDAAVTPPPAPPAMTTPQPADIDVRNLDDNNIG